MIKSCPKCILFCLTRLDLVLNLSILSGGQSVLSCQLGPEQVPPQRSGFKPISYMLIGEP
jgi:hypothetical protein